MRMYDIITKKKRGEELSEKEIRFFVEGSTKGSIPDYQASALLMAICLKSMTDKETSILTSCMADSGDRIDLSAFGQLSVDKHSTGGVGDKTSLIVAPIVASCGCKMAKMSGRGLGHTGGTVDKLESIDGYKTVIPESDFFYQADNIGIAMIGQSGNLTPADKKLYALRDVTATVDSIPLIASSIMSKKLAAGAKNIVLDVKVGSGAFMRTLEDARELARLMVEIGRQAGRNVSALITNMDVPLGKNVGNSLEVIEAVSVLRGETRGELRDISLELSASLISMSLSLNYNDAYTMAENALDSGKAFEKMKEWIGSQCGNTALLDDTSLFKKAKYAESIVSDRDGYILSMNTESVGIASCKLGAGRATKDDVIDLSAGIVIEKKTGDKVRPGDILATMYTNDIGTLKEAADIYLSAIDYSDKPTEKPILIFDRI